ncbi:MAG: nuclear transport factor 2 family protein [Rhodospirillaceae bacterium]|nr:nuclear transport factor 2 family protein [Rhodospirillaceae bacterium]
MTEFERLSAIEEIKQLKARYFRCMDTKDWAGMVDVYAPDAEADFRAESPDGFVKGAAQIVAYTRGSIATVTTVHHGHMPEITVLSADEAVGVWAMEDLLYWPEGEGITRADGTRISRLHGFGHYHETYRVHGGRWRIQTLRLTRLRVEVG